MVYTDTGAVYIRAAYLGIATLDTAFVDKAMPAVLASQGANFGRGYRHARTSAITGSVAITHARVLGAQGQGVAGTRRAVRRHCFARTDRLGAYSGGAGFISALAA